MDYSTISSSLNGFFRLSRSFAPGTGTDSSLTESPITVVGIIPRRTLAAIQSGGFSGNLDGNLGFWSACVCSRATRRKCRGVNPIGPRNLPKTAVSSSFDSLVPRATYGLSWKSKE
jgi:hypothetical protein